MNYQPHFFQGAPFYPRPMQQQYQMQQAYSWGNMNYQPNAFQNGPYFGPLQFQPAHYMQGSNNSIPQNFQTPQFNQENPVQGLQTDTPATVGQPNHSVHGASQSLNPVVTEDDEWAGILQTIDNLAPIVPATYPQMTSASPLTVANNQAAQGSTTAMPTQQP